MIVHRTVAIPSTVTPLAQSPRVLAQRKDVAASALVWPRHAWRSLVLGALCLCASTAWAQSDGEMSMAHPAADAAAGVDDGAMQWVGPQSNKNTSPTVKRSRAAVERLTPAEGAPHRALSVNAGAHPLGPNARPVASDPDMTMSMPEGGAGSMGNGVQAGLLPARTPTGSEADARTAAEATLRAAAIRTSNAASNVSRDELLAQPTAMGRAPATPLATKPTSEPVDRLAGAMPNRIPSMGGNTKVAAVRAQQQADAATEQAAGLTTSTSLPVATVAVAAPVAQPGAALPMALPPLPTPGGWANAGTAQWIAPVATASVVSASDIEPVEPSDQPLGGYAGDQFERLGLDATHMHESAWRQLGAHAQPLPTGTLAWDLRLYRVTKGRVEMVYSGSARATPLDPSWLQGATHGQPTGSTAPKGRPGRLNLHTNDALNATPARNGESAPGQLKAELLWRPKSVFWGDAVELALSASVVVGVDEIEASKGTERFARESRTKFLGFFELQQPTPQMAWLPLDGAERIEESENGSTGGWLIAVGPTGSFSQFDVQKALTSARDGHF